jgi:16S rRNA processing protein RimM
MEKSFITVGKIIRPYGTKGALRVKPLTDFPQRFKDLKKIWVQPPEGKRVRMEIEKVEWKGGSLILSFQGLSTRPQAQVWTNSYIEVTADERHPLEEGHYYISDLLGLPIYTEEGHLVGQVEDVWKLPANDVWAVKTDSGQKLIPATKEIIKAVDFPCRRIVIHNLDGLLE